MKASANLLEFMLDDLGIGTLDGDTRPYIRAEHLKEKVMEALKKRGMEDQ